MIPGCDPDQFEASPRDAGVLTGDEGYLAALSVRVLVVDDFEPFRRSMALLLEQQANLEIISEAADGEEAIQKAETLQPDLILLDLGIPKLHGLEAARRIRVLSPKSK